jgi:hypothetical protein
MTAIPTFLQSLGVAYAAGINLPATVAILGIAQRQAWVDGLPPALQLLASPWVIAVAVAIYLVEFVATLIPGVASALETAQSFVRPVAGSLLAAVTAFHFSPVLGVLAALVGGTLALSTHGAKLGVRYAVDTSPEPFTNGIANMTELAIVSAVVTFVWAHPYITVTLALIALVLMFVLFRAVIRGVRKLIDRLSGAAARAD